MEEQLFILRPAGWQRPDHYEVMAGEWASVTPLQTQEDGPADGLKVGEALAKFESGEWVNGILVQDQTVITSITSIDFADGEVRIRARIRHIKAAIDFEHEPSARCLRACAAYLAGSPCYCSPEREVVDGRD